MERMLRIIFLSVGDAREIPLFAAFPESFPNLVSGAKIIKIHSVTAKRELSGVKGEKGGPKRAKNGPGRAPKTAVYQVFIVMYVRHNNHSLAHFAPNALKRLIASSCPFLAAISTAVNPSATTSTSTPSSSTNTRITSRWPLHAAK